MHGLHQDVPSEASSRDQRLYLGLLPVTLVQMAQIELTAVFMKVAEGYIAFVEELPGANTQGETLDEARANLEEAVAMVLTANRDISERSLQGAEVIREPFAVRAA